MTSGQQASVGTESETAPGNLPPQLTPLLGRETELRALRSLAWDTRLLTLSGPGGAGKSRLAIALAEALREDLVDGAWWVDLAASIDSGLVSQALVRAVLPGSPAPDPAAALARRFAAPALVVLDNCEAVRDGCAQVVAELLARASTVRIVATSRQPLGVMGEQVWRVGGLDLDREPALGEGPDERSGAPTGGAMKLFMQRAREADGAFDPDAAGTRDAVETICRWLDGMPLAIELAAARVSVFGMRADRRASTPRQWFAAPPQPRGSQPPTHPGCHVGVELPVARAGRATPVPAFGHFSRRFLAGRRRSGLRR